MRNKHELKPRRGGIKDEPFKIIASHKTSLAITWIKDKSLADLDNLPDPDELAVDIVENLEGALESFKAVIASLNAKQ